MDNEMPQRINVMKIVTYDVFDVISQIQTDRESSHDETEVTLDDVLERIEEWTKDDFSCGFGHEIDHNDLIFQDENGNDL